MEEILNDHRILGIGGSVFSSLGLEGYFPNYQILTHSNSSWQHFFPELSQRVFLLNDIEPSFSRSYKPTTENILAHTDWKKLRAQIKFDHVLSYKPCQEQAAVTARHDVNFLTNSYSLFSQIENKASVRELLGKEWGFPAFDILSLEELKIKSFSSFFTKFGRFLIQDTISSGGRGTYTIDSPEDFQQALSTLSKHRSQKVVVSKYIAGRIASIQACVSKYGIFSLNPQLQLEKQPALTNLQSSKANQFAGGQWSIADFSESEKTVIKNYAQLAGKKLQTMGYKGIFGIDFIITKKHQIHPIEINARLTGMTTVLNLLTLRHKRIPLLLLHTLEMLPGDYHLSEKQIAHLGQQHFDDFAISYLIIYNNTKNPIKVRNTFEPGIYEWSGQKPHQFDLKQHTYSLKNLTHGNQILFLDFPQNDTIVEPDKPLGRVIINRPALTKRGTFAPDAETLVETIRQQLV